MYKKYGSPEMLQMAVHSADCRMRKADPFLAGKVFGLMHPRKKTPETMADIGTKLFVWGKYIYSC